MRKLPVPGTDPELHDLIDDQPSDSPLDESVGPVVPSSLPRRSLVIRVSRSTWAPQAGVPDLVITSRLGDVLAGEGSSATIRALEGDPEVLSIEASREAGHDDCATSVPAVRATAVHTAATAQTGSDALVAVIDGGIDVLHQAFLGATGASRILGIWDQRDSTGPPPLGHSYGTWSSAVDIAGYLAGSAMPPGLAARDPKGHGTHVASIAAGRAAGGFAGGVAPDAKLLIVVSALSPLPGAPRSIGYSRSHIDALAFIDQFASQSGLPVVVNLSQGMNAGAHDGSSALERAFDNFSGGGRIPGRIIVKSAGNERGQAGHALLQMTSNGLDQLTWRSLPSARVYDVVEGWYSPSDDISFRLETPGAAQTSWVDWAHPQASGTFPSGAQYLLTLERFHVDNGASRLFLRVRPNPAGVIPAGIWKLDVKAGQVAAGGEVNAWVERVGSRALKFTNHVVEATTLSIPGSADSIITVAATDGAGGALGAFSSYGPTRDGRSKPDISAPGLGIEAALGGTSTGTQPMNGTSMAAPHVAGAIALALSAGAASTVHQVNARQARAALAHLARNYNGSWHQGRGYGFLDAEALITGLF